jgi:type IV fimbrial biogenesis protein FimT
MKKQTGFTLVELLIVIGMIALISLISIPNVIGMLPDYRLRSAAHDLFSNFQKAKLEGVKRNINTAVCFSAGGYTVFVDADGDFVQDGGEDVIVATNWSEYKDVSVTLGNVTFDNSSGQPCVAFQPNGIPVDNGGGSASGTAPIDNTKGKITAVIVSNAGNIRIN